MAAIALYIGSFLTAIWMYAHDFSRESDPGLNDVTWLMVMLIMPLVVGFAIGRYWAPLLVVFLFISTALVSDLEPLQRPEPAEVEIAPILIAIYTAVLHAPLLLVGAWVRKRLSPRNPGKGLFSLHPPTSCKTHTWS